MRISISCNYGTWRPVYLASKLDNLGYLHRLYVPYHRQKFPYSILWRYFKLGKVREINVTPDKVSTNIFYTLLNEAVRRRLPIARSFLPQSRYILNEFLDRSVSKKIDDKNDVVIAQSELALHTIKKAKKYGAIGVLDRTNCHIEYQTELLREEFKKFGLEYKIDERVIQKGLLEYEAADYIFVLSSFAKRTFIEKNVPKDKLILIPSGVDLTRFEHIDKKDDVFRIIYCGAIQAKKGVHYLLQAFSELSLKNAELWLIGSVFEEMNPILEEYKGLYNIKGYIPNHLLYKYFSQGSVFVLPSIEEGMAKVMLEAMACGLPVIATTNTGAEDIIHDGVEGFIIPIRDVKALKEKIAYMYENEAQRVEMGRNAKKRVSKSFTWEDYANRVIKACEYVLNERRLLSSRREGG